MQKITIYQIYTYSLIGLISLTPVPSKTTSALTQKVVNSSVSPTIANLIWPTQGIVSQGFRKYQHEGIDIAGASGTPIVAAASGTVIKAGWDDWGLGNFIEIKHPDGSFTVYGHNRRLLVSKGQQVNQGQIIAEMGSTGNSTAPHLHFEFHPNSRIAVDPLRLLPSSTTAKIPPPTIVNPNRQISLPPTPQPASPSQPIPVKFTPAIAHPQCDGITVIEGETVNLRVKVCQEQGQLFYIGQLKQDPSQPIKIPAWNLGTNKYQANNGTFSYLVSHEKVEVWRNGNLVRSDSFYTSTRR